MTRVVISRLSLIKMINIPLGKFIKKVDKIKELIENIMDIICMMDNLSMVIEKDLGD